MVDWAVDISKHTSLVHRISYSARSFITIDFVMSLFLERKAQWAKLGLEGKTMGIIIF